MDAATVGVISTLGAAVIVGLVAFYGHRVNSRSGLMTGYNMLTADLRQERTELRQDLAALKAELAAERAAHEALKAENSVLRAQVIALGGTP